MVKWSWYGEYTCISTGGIYNWHLPYSVLVDEGAKILENSLFWPGDVKMRHFDQDAETALSSFAKPRIAFEQKQEAYGTNPSNLVQINLVNAKKSSNGSSLRNCFLKRLFKLHWFYCFFLLVFFWISRIRSCLSPIVNKVVELNWTQVIDKREKQRKAKVWIELNR